MLPAIVRNAARDQSERLPTIVGIRTQDRTVRLWAAELGREIAILASPKDDVNRPTLTHAALNSDGTKVVIVSGEEGVRIVRTFQTSQDLIDFVKTTVSRKLTPCERRRFFLPVEGDVGDCSG